LVNLSGTPQEKRRTSNSIGLIAKSVQMASAHDNDVVTDH